MPSNTIKSDTQETIESETTIATRSPLGEVPPFLPPKWGFDVQCLASFIWPSIHRSVRLGWYHSSSSQASHESSFVTLDILHFRRGQKRECPFAHTSKAGFKWRCYRHRANKRVSPREWIFPDSFQGDDGLGFCLPLENNRCRQVATGGNSQSSRQLPVLARQFISFATFAEPPGVLWSRLMYSS